MTDTHVETRNLRQGLHNIASEAAYLHALAMLPLVCLSSITNTPYNLAWSVGWESWLGRAIASIV